MASRRTPQELAADAARKRERRLRFEREGLCNICGKRKPALDRKACKRCLEAASERTMKWWNHKDGWQRLREKRWEWRAKGLCYICGLVVLRGVLTVVNFNPDAPFLEQPFRYIDSISVALAPSLQFVR